MKAGNEWKLPFAETTSARYVWAMSTLVEIQEAITRLGDDEKSALSLWLQSQTAPAMAATDEQRLLRYWHGARGSEPQLGVETGLTA